MKNLTFFKKIFILIILLFLCACSKSNDKDDIDPKDFSKIEGTWYEETGLGIININSDGTYSIEFNEGKFEGYLIYNEKDKNNIYYDMYLNDGERFKGEGKILIDEDYPGSITLAQSYSAVLYWKDKK